MDKQRGYRNKTLPSYSPNFSCNQKCQSVLRKNLGDSVFHSFGRARCDSSIRIVCSFFFPAVFLSCMHRGAATHTHTLSQYFFHLSAISFCLWPIYHPRVLFCTHFYTDLSPRCTNKQRASWKKKRKQQDETLLPPSRLASLHFDNWETFGTRGLASENLWIMVTIGRFMVGFNHHLRYR